MALNAILFSNGLYGFRHFSEANERYRVHKLSCLVTATAFRAGSKGAIAMSLKCCSFDHVGRRIDDLGKAHTMSPLPQLAHEPNGSLKLVNGHSARRSPFVFSEHLLTEKIVVAVDVDEVLGSFLPAVNKFIADRYSLNHSLEDYFVYEFYKIWNCSPTEADIRVHEFFETSYFKMGIHPIPGAKSILQSLSLFCNLYVVTSRQNAIKDQTLEWIEKHYPGLFQEVHFGNYFALDGQSRPKSEICRSLGAQVLIDDNPRFALECAEAGTKVLLFDYDNSYPWCKSGTAASHPQVTIVQNWREVKQHLLSWTKCPENNKYA
ncbi:5'(3')-deoxyribonucleotidase protein [Dioscorea alata]|uniref:5'(3')-deoxyribonucleotidase protein n=1 Tax=Dioscorea alata TaxID=55571 RepID=A0ACB7U4Y1_DIOAL|nr:5'(3')-deoxyribonucleotidase protein [Dioscorea alata]